MSAARDVYDEAIRLYNAADVEGFAGLHAEEAVLVTPSGTTQGRDAIRAYWTRIRAAFPDLTLRADMVIEQGDTVVAEWTETGTDTGPLVLPDGSERPPTGRRMEHRGMEVALVRDAKIVEYRMYWDRMAIAEQLGRLPAGSTA
ncbi:MAG TPA: ester cyclase [Pseudonocardiaceae bacterium]|nr:ester cyclase [Pseudonocardiaceae bacterium]